MSDKKLLYWSWIKAEAKAINSDGCSWVSELYRPCCLQHDLSYYYAKLPESAYSYYIQDVVDPWEQATWASRLDADQGFKACIQKRSRIKKWSPLSWIRYAGVRLFGSGIWEGHRSRINAK